MKILKAILNFILGVVYFFVSLMVISFVGGIFVGIFGGNMQAVRGIFVPIVSLISIALTIVYIAVPGIRKTIYLRLNKPQIPPQA